MPEISPRIPPANHTPAGLIDRTFILRILLALDVHPHHLATLAGEHQPMPPRPRRQHTIHHVHPHLRVLLDLVRIPHTHHIPRLILRQNLQPPPNHPPSPPPRLPPRQPPNRIPRKPHPHQPLSRFLPQIRIHPTLHNPKQTLRSPTHRRKPRHPFFM